MAEVERFGPGDEAKNFVPGDFILSHRHHFVAGLITLAQKRRFRGSDAVYAHWSHAALIVETDGALVEAEMTGIRLSPISKYRDDEYHLVYLGPDVASDARARAVAFGKSSSRSGCRLPRHGRGDSLSALGLAVEARPPQSRNLFQPGRACAA